MHWLFVVMVSLGLQGLQVAEMLPNGHNSLMPWKERGEGGGEKSSFSRKL